MTKIDETKEIVVGITARDYYIDTRKLDYLYSQLKGKNVIFEESPKQFYANLGKNETEYIFSSINQLNKVKGIVDAAESLGLNHEMRFVDSVSVKMNPYFYVANDVKGNLSMITKYHEDTFISSETLRDLVLNGYNIEFDGILVVITLGESKGIKEDLESFKALADKFPKGFYK